MELFFLYRPCHRGVVVLEYNLESIRGPLGELLLYLDGPDVYAATPAARRAEASISAIRRMRDALYKHCKLPRTLKETGRVTEDQLERIADVALDDGAIMFNPKEVVPYGQKRYHDETKRLYRVMDKRLGEVEYLAGDKYTIADIATYPWVARFERHQVDLNDFSNVKRWFYTISKRPAVEKGMGVPFFN